MSDRFQNLTVVLEMDVREEGAEMLIEAIRQIRGVLSVVKGEPVDFNAHIGRERAKRELREKVWDLIK